MRAARRHLALQAHAGQLVVDHAARARIGGRGRDVLGLQPLGRIPAAAHGRVLGADQADHLVLEQAGHVQALRRLGPVADHHVHIALGQLHFVVRVAVERQDVHGAAGRLGLEMGHQARQEQRVQVVAGGDAEGARGGAGIEMARIAEQALGRAQDVGGRLHHAQPRLGGLHVGARAHQQRIARQVAQALERSGHRRLVHAQAQCGTRDAALGQHRVQHPDQMQINLVEQGLVAHVAKQSPKGHDAGSRRADHEKPAG